MTCRLLRSAHHQDCGNTPVSLSQRLDWPIAAQRHSRRVRNWWRMRRYLVVCNADTCGVFAIEDVGDRGRSGQNDCHWCWYADVADGHLDVDVHIPYHIGRDIRNHENRSVSVDVLRNCRDNSRGDFGRGCRQTCRRGASRYPGEPMEFLAVMVKYLLTRWNIEDVMYCGIIIKVKSIIRRSSQEVEQSINQSNDRSINQTINQSINQTNNPTINQSIEQSINQSIDRLSNQSIKQSTHQLIYLTQPRTVIWWRRNRRRGFVTAMSVIRWIPAMVMSPLEISIPVLAAMTLGHCAFCLVYRQPGDARAHVDQPYNVNSTSPFKR